MQKNIVQNFLQLKHTFGIQKSNHNIQIFDNNIIFFIVGHNVAKLKLKEKVYSYIQANENCGNMCALALSTNKDIVAVAEVSNLMQPVIYLYDSVSLRKKTFLALEENDEMIKNYYYLKFKSTSSDFLCAAANGNQQFLYFWRVSSGKICYKMKLDHQIHSIQFSSIKKNEFLIVGYQTVKLFRIDNENIQILNDNIVNEIYEKRFQNVRELKESGRYVFHDDQRNIFVVSQQGQLLCQIQIEKDIINIECTKKGVLLFFNNFEAQEIILSEEDYSYNISQNYYNDISNKQELISIVYDNDSETAIIQNKNGHIFQFIKNNQQLSSNFIPIAEEFHFDAITGMSLALKKPLLATSSKDKSIKIWNYQQSRLEHHIQLNDEPIQVILHPSGHHIVILYQEKIQIKNLNFNYSIYHKRDIKEMNLKNISYGQISDGGQFLAIASGSPQIINIYKFYTGQKLQNLILKGHSGNVTNLQFRQRDTILYSCGTDGIVYKWNMLNGQRTEIVTKGAPLNDMIIQDDCTNVYLASRDSQSLVEVNSKEKKYINGQDIYSNIKLLDKDEKTIFASVAKKKGDIIHFTNLTDLNNYRRYKAHDNKGVSCMQVSHDRRNLISCGNDGSICIFGIYDNESSRGVVYLDEDILQSTREILVTKNELEELKHKKDNLLNHFTDNRFQSNNIMNLNNLDDQIKSLKMQRQKVETQEKLNVENFIEQKVLKQKIQEQQLSQFLQKNEEELQEIEHEYNKEISSEAAKLEASNREHEKMEKDYILKLKNIKNEYNILLQQLQQDFRDQIEQKRKTQEKLSEELKHIEDVSKRKMQVVEEEKIFEQTQIKEKYNVEIENKREETNRIKSQAITLNKKKENFESQIQSNIEILKEKLKTIAPLEHKLQNLHQDIQSQQENIIIKQKTIADKEKKLYQLKKETQELEKFKEVLDYTITELNNETIPKQNQIRHLKQLIAKEDERLKNYNNVNTNLEIVIASLEKNSNTMKQKIKKNKEKYIRVNAKIEKLKNYIFQNVQWILDYKLLKENLLKIDIKKKEEEIGDEKIDLEYANQVKYLQTSVNKFRINIKKDNDIHKKDNANYIKENTNLITEILKLKKELKCFKQSEKPETIMLRKDKRLRNIMTDAQRKMTVQEKINFHIQQEKQIFIKKQQLERISLEEI